MSDWERIEDGIGTTEEPYWWHVDNWNAISHDGGETYYMLDEPLGVDGNPRVYRTDQRPVKHRDYPKTLEQAAQYAAGHASMAWEDLTHAGVFQEDIARQAADDLVKWVNDHYTKKENTSA